MTPRDAAHYALTVTLDRLSWEPLDLAHHIGCNPRTVARWVSGECPVNLLAVDQTKRFRVLFREEYEAALLREVERAA